MEIKDFKYNFSARILYEVTIDFLSHHDDYDEDMLDVYGFEDNCWKNWVERICLFLESLSDKIFYENGYCTEDDELDNDTMFIITNDSLDDISKHIAICIDAITKDDTRIDIINYSNFDQLIMFIKDRLVYVGPEECTGEGVYNLSMSSLLNDLGRSFGVKGDLFYDRSDE